MKLRRLMVPRWKMRRELRSLREQIAALPELIVGPLRKRRADRRFPHDLRIADGAAPASARIAIYLTFQPNGLAESTLIACRHLAERGYAVLLVANAPIADADRERLAPHVWRFVQRVNFGYDFGGYRDGLQLLQHWQARPRYLIVLNDSIWFPLYPQEDLIARMEGSEAAFVGAQRYVDHLDDLEERTGILMSFLFLFKAPLLESPEFRRFWRSYVPSSSKVLTVRRGERRFSRQLIARGQTGDGIYSPVRFLQAMAQQSTEFLAKTLDYAAYTDADLERESGALLAEPVRDDSWRDRVLVHLRTTSGRRNFCSAFPYASIQALGVPFLKKNRAELQMRMRRQFLRAVAAGELPRPVEAIFREIERSVE
ncbi:MAG TPA: rhamnan synthesis F family protein [Rhodocyclaceae bacterium]